MKRKLARLTVYACSYTAIALCDSAISEGHFVGMNAALIVFNLINLIDMEELR